MNKLLLLILFTIASTGRFVVAQEPVVPLDLAEEIELAQEELSDPGERLPHELEVEGLPETPLEAQLRESDKLKHPDLEPNEDVGLKGEIWRAQPHETEAPPRSRRYPFRHLSEMPGQYRGDWLSLIKMKYVRNEIELLPEQRKAIHQVMQKMSKQSRKIVREHTVSDSLPHENPDEANELHERISALRDNAVEEIRNEILLPVQVDRLIEIDFQLKMKSLGVVATLKDQSLGLNVSKDQIESIETRAIELVSEYDLLVRSFKIDFRNQILDELDASQRAKVESMMGAEMQIKEDEGDESVQVTEKLKEAALEKLQEWRNKQ